MTNEYIYKPNEIDSDMFLSEVPLSLMKENIIAQFDDPLEYRKKDHITTFINMYKYTKNNVNVYEDEEIDNVIELRDEFYSFMQRIFKNYLGIGIVNFDDMSEEEQDNLIHYTYRFFLINIKKNFVSFIINTIFNNKESYIFDEEKRKDITTLSFRKEITNPEDINIIANLSIIIDSILSDEIDIDDFFKYCDNDPCLETRYVKSKFDNLVLTGNFMNKYIEMIDDDFRSEIESKVRNKILKSYKKSNENNELLQ